MSNTEPNPGEMLCSGRDAETGPVRELLTGRDVVLGGTRGMPVSRTLPNKDHRMVGAWCFLDAYGPQDLVAGPGMRVGPHPHTGLQTVSWLLAGEILHRDGLGNEQLIRPGQLNLMTAGSGIAHSEETPVGHTPVLHGVQLWVALPDTARNVRPDFVHHAVLPLLREHGMSVTLMIGELGDMVSPARAYTPIVGAEVTLQAGVSGRLPLRDDFEYAVLSMSGTATVDGTTLSPGPLLYLGSGRTELALSGPGPARLLLLGGEPFAEEIVMWWNFVGRDHDAIALAREDWTAGRRFAEVRGYDGARLPAPELPGVRLKPRGRMR